MNVTDKNRLTFNYRNGVRTQSKRFYFPDDLATGNYLYRNSTGATLDDVHMLSPSTVMDVRLNWTNYLNGHAEPADGFNPTTLGFPSYVAANAELLPALRELPQPS